MSLSDILKGAIILNGILTGVWGLFYQFVVGGALNMLCKCDEKGARALMMSWVGHGAFLSLSGFLPAILLLFHDSRDPAVITTFIVLSLALLLLSIHVAATGLRLAVIPIRVGWVLQSLQAVLLFLCLIRP